ncbi:permease [Methylocella tundrae]|uniref:Putative permease n=1 Tax=Methylocella tundrae TaxID=227605 RepID=A0A4V6IMK4_METTU|nr:permease [Methylocella tundrae]WPP06164.1 permease [Methylocella tundrae]VFU08794.1 putative permease [Methylocella tundrae]
MNTTRQNNPAMGWITFFLIAAAGLFYVKWLPYYNRAFVAAATHSIGQSILMGKAASPPSPSISAALDYAWVYGKAIWQAMVLGLLLGSATQALLPVNWVAKALGRTEFGSVAAGGLLSIPGMMCTCCAAPIVVGLRERQASAGGAIAFWLGNTVLNPATIVFMGFVLGWNWSALRLALGLLMVFGLGYLVNRMVTPKEAEEAEARLATLVGNTPTSGAFTRWMRILWRMSVRLVPEYIVLVLLLGAARAWLFPQIDPQIDNHLIWIVALAVAGTIFVIPTAGEVPIIQAMLSLGMGVGPAGALLMTLPPISAPSVAMLARSFPPRVLALVTASVVAFGVIGGLLAVALRF